MQTMSENESYTIASYNIGYGSYPPDYTFFMGEGKESVGRSKENVIENILGSANLLKEYNLDFILLQEVDIEANRC